MTASEQEKVVREYWEHVENLGTRKYPIPSIDGRLFQMPHGFNHDEGWQYAQAYTLDHQQKRAELEYQLYLQKVLVADMDATPPNERNPHDHDDDRNALARTANILQSLLEQHMRGVRTEKGE